jgi:hypothetical protein
MIVHQGILALPECASLLLFLFLSVRMEFRMVMKKTLIVVAAVKHALLVLTTLHAEKMSVWKMSALTRVRTPLARTMANVLDRLAQVVFVRAVTQTSVVMEFSTMMKRISIVEGAAMHASRAWMMSNARRDRYAVISSAHSQNVLLAPMDFIMEMKRMSTVAADALRA